MPDPNQSLPRSEDELELNPQWSGFARVPAWYRVEVELGGEDGAQNANSVQLRPEPFVLKRITWATTGDALADLNSGVALGGSIQGRSVMVQWEDEFTKFFGNRPMLVSSVFGDSNGFLDLPRGMIFSGKQTLSVNLSRLFWPGADETQETTLWHFVFSGFGLLRGEYQSGSAG
ncbi:MAG TPA: hypothetical protein VJR89_02320 [Polyangiales bacterium]|nr:hypothetical protein [Polyangiales bacterium]